MKFKVTTLVDITETRVNRNDGTTAYKQQQNFTTLLQTIGIKVNPVYTTSPQMSSVEVDGMFGTNAKGEHTIWTWDFEVEYEGGITVDEMVEMIDLLPVLSNLDESIKINKDVFHTKDKKYKNTIIEDLINKTVN